MRKVLFAVALLLVTTVAGSAAGIRGSYIESRNADVYVAHCFANSEAGLAGELAVMGWKIEEGAWNNVPLAGLGVVAVVRASHTLGDPYRSAYPAKAILIVDQRANAEQREALQNLAKKMAGDLVQTVARVDVAPIEFDFNGNLHGGTAQLTAGDLVRVQTRSLRDGDAVCHNAFTYYPPLSKVSHAMPARAVDTRFSGEGLNVTWSIQDKNSAFLGTFETESE